MIKPFTRLVNMTECIDEINSLYQEDQLSIQLAGLFAEIELRADEIVIVQSHIPGNVVK